MRRKSGRKRVTGCTGLGEGAGAYQHARAYLFHEPFVTVWHVPFPSSPDCLTFALPSPANLGHYVGGTVGI